MSISPNDPIVMVLQQAVQQLKSELKADVDDMEAATMAVIKQFGGYIKDLSSRLDTVEDALFKMITKQQTQEPKP